MQIATLIMAGGRGERVWPIGRQDRPKQFLKVKSENTLIEDTIIRAKTFCDEKNIFIIMGEFYKASLDSVLPDFPEDNIIFEPSRRDTAAAIAFGVYTIEQRIPDAVIVTLPADPFIEGIELFTTVVKKSIDCATEKDLAVTIGITPTRAETDYGYVHTDTCISGDDEIKVYKIDSFVEKPNKEKAEIMYKDSNYLWNSGMFVWKSSVILDYMKNLEPDTYAKIVDAYNYSLAGEKDKALEAFDSIVKKSIDFAIMEKLTESLCIKGDFVWDDVGSFSALSRVYTPDDQGNVKIGDNLLYKSENTTVMNNDDNTFVAVCGMKDIIVVNHKGATLIYPKGQDGMIKEVIAQLEAQGNTKHL